MSLLLTKASLTNSPWLLDEALGIISQDTQFLRSSYPRFDEWLALKVLPGIRIGERTLLVEVRNSTAVGLLILKHTEVERKLCTLRVRPHHESKGLGVRLFHKAFELLGTEHPLLSISEFSAPKFERLFRHFGFAQEAVYEGRYLPMVDELAYNGLLDPTPMSTHGGGLLPVNQRARPHSYFGTEVLSIAQQHPDLSGAMLAANSAPKDWH